MSDPYADPVLYDLEYADYTEDLAFYVRLGRIARGPILELCCGNGRVTLPLAQAGATVHGVDISTAMLLDLERKLRAEPDNIRMRIRLSQGDIRDWTASHRHPLVLLPFNALHHIHSKDELALLFQRIRDWTLPGGTLAFDCYLPDLNLMARDPAQKYEQRTFIDPRSGDPLSSWEQGWWEAERRLHHVVYSYEAPDGRLTKAHLKLFMLQLEEWHELIAEAGWTIRHEARDFRGSPLTERSLKLVVIATR
jgi:SAM-dependent methyltransferase